MISAIIPAHNEADRVAATVRAVFSLERVDEVVVVDDGSTDDTAQLADAAGACVVRLDTQGGKGAALEAGARIARGDVLLMLDADLGECASQARPLFDAILQDEADMAIASFPVIPGKGGGRGWVVRLARWGIRRATGRAMVAPLSGQRALKREVWDRVGPFAQGFGVEVALTIDAMRVGYRVVELPTTMTHRVTGRDIAAGLHRARQFIAVARVLLPRLLRARPS